MEKKLNYNKEQLMQIEQNVASGWGACCMSYKILKDSVEFTCNEFGEVFTTTVPFEELNEYDY